MAKYNYRSLPGITGVFVPEDLRKHRVFKNFMELFDVLFLGDIRKQIHEKWDYLYDPMRTSNLEYLLKIMTGGMSLETAMKYFACEKDIRVWLNYLPVASDNKFSLSWFSQAASIATGTMLRIESDTDCQLKIFYDETSGPQDIEAAKLFILEWLGESGLACTSLTSFTVTEPAIIDTPGC